MERSEIEVIRTQSICGLSSIEFGNRTKSNTELCVSSISEPIELHSWQVKPNRTQSIRLCSIGSVVGFGGRTQSNTIQWTALDCVR